MTVTTPSIAGRRSIAALLVGTALAGIAPPAFAQDLAASAVSGDDIIVTARNREERLQDVPLTVNAITGEQIDRAGIRDLKDISFTTPGLVINGGGAETLTRPSIRGLPSSEGDPTVAIFYDGAYLFSNGANNIAFMDIERVEVVKGPVNSLYGRPAYAGAINYISKLPTSDFNGRILGTFGNDGQRKLTGAIGGAIIPDILMVRLAGYYEKYDGAWRDQVNGLKQGELEKRDAQLSVLFQPTPEFTVNGRVYYGDDVFGMNPITYNDNNCGAFNASYAPFTHQTFFCGLFDEKQQPFQVNPSSQEPQYAGNRRKVLNTFLKMNYDVGFGDLTSLTTYTDVEFERIQDFFGRRDGIAYELVTQADALANPRARSTPVGVINLLTNFGARAEDKDFAQEIRFTSRQDQPFRFNVGGYYAKLKSYFATILSIDAGPIPAGLTIQGNATTCALFQCDRVFLTPDGSVSPAITQGQTTSRLYSGFAGVEYDPLDALTLSVDARYSSDRRTIDSITSNSAFTGNGANTVYTLRPIGPPKAATFSFWTGRASVRWKITSDQMVYATFATGVKPGGFNVRAVNESEIAYGNEKNKTYEVGFKTQFGRGFQLNGSAFYIDISDLQSTGPSSFLNNPGLITTNIGGARSKGFELDALVRPSDWLSFTAGVGYADATYKNGSFDFGFAATCTAIGPNFCDPGRIRTITTTADGPNGPVNTQRTVFDRGGLQIQYAPKWTISLGADVNYPVADDMNLLGNIRYRHQSKQFANTQNHAWFGPLDRVDVRVGIEKGPLIVTAFVDNLLNNTTPDSVGQSTYTNDFSTGYFAALPFLRRYGVTAEFKF